MNDRSQVTTRDEQRMPAEATRRAMLPPVDIFEDEHGITPAQPMRHGCCSTRRGRIRFRP